MEDAYTNYHKFRGNDIHQLNEYLPQYFLNVLPPSTSHILDIGCGNGELLYALKKRGYLHLQGIDLDKDAVHWVRQNGIACENINVLQYKPDKQFDFITINHVLEHLPKKEVIPLLTYIRNELLAPHGKIMIRVPNAQSYTGCYWAYEDFTHETLYTAGSLSYVLKCSGYMDISFIDPAGLEDSHGWKKLIRRWLLFLYEKKIDFWNLVTGGSFHKPSPRIYT